MKLDPGLIVIISPPEVAAISIDQPTRRLESAGDGAADAARNVLNTPSLGHPQLEAAAGVVGFTLVPFAATYGAIRARQQHLSADQLSEAEKELAATMRSSAGSACLREKVAECARQKTHRLLACADSLAAVSASSMPVSAVLEVAVEQLRLKAAKAGRDDRVLYIQARARLRRASDGTVLLERSYQYQSGAAWFIDWVRGLENVAQTGYQSLAEEIADEIFQPAPAPPILIGPGQKHTGMHLRRTDRSLIERALSPALPSFQFVSLRSDEPAAMEIHTRGAGQALLIPKPGSESTSSVESGSETEAALDGLQNDRNSVVQFVSCLASVPLGIWEQTVGAIRKGPRERAEKLVTALNRVGAQAHFEQKLADEVSRRVQAQSVGAIRRADEPIEFALPGLREASTAGPHRAGQHASCQTAVEIQVVATELAGKHRTSRSRALSVEIQVKVCRTADGQELYSCPIRYRSSVRNLKDWAAADGKLLRDELDACSRQAAQVLATELVTRGFVVPNSPAGTPTLRHL